MSESFDTNGDGWLDATPLDIDADGYTDTYVLDTNFDGFYDAAAVDRDADGFAEELYLDQNQDGVYETAAIDQTGDRRSETYLYDTDGDGVLETVVVDNDGNGVSDAEQLDVLVGPVTNPDPFYTLMLELAEETGQVAFGPTDSDRDGWSDTHDARPHDPFRS